MTATTKPAPVLTQLLGVELTGNLSIVTPGPIDEVAEPLLVMIDKAVALHREGSTMRAGAMIADVERRLGVTDADRAEAARPRESWEVDLEEALANLTQEERDEVEAFLLPEDIERLTPAEERLADAAIAEMAKAKTAGNREIAQRKLRRPLESRARRVESAWRTSALNETVTLARLRDETIDAEPGNGQLRPVRRQSGLEWLWSKGRISAVQREAGERYGADYHAATDISLKSCMAEGGGGGLTDRMEFRSKAQDRLKAARERGLSNHADMIRYCDLISGEGERIRSIVGGDDVETRRVEAVFLVALDLLAAHYGVS